MLIISCNFGGLKVSESGQNKQFFNQIQATTLIHAPEYWTLAKQDGYHTVRKIVDFLKL